MQEATVGQANVLYQDLAAKADGSAITSGTVTFHLIATSGDNAGKWFQSSDDSWQAAEASAGTATHKAVGHWYCSIASDAWISGVQYILYAKESGSLNIDYSESIQLISTVKLAPDGLDNIVVTEPTTVATTFPQMVVQLWRRFFKKTTSTKTQLKTYKNNDSTTVTTQTTSDDGTTKTVGAAS